MRGRSAAAAAATTTTIGNGRLWVHDSRRGGEESKAENQEHQYLFHGRSPLVSLVAVAVLARGSLRCVRDDGDDRHASGKREGEGQNYENPLHDGFPTRSVAVAVIASHRLIGMRDHCYDRHARGECEGQGQNQDNLSHNDLLSCQQPLPPQPLPPSAIA